MKWYTIAGLAAGGGILYYLLTNREHENVPCQAVPGMTSATRRTQEGYILSAMIEPEHVPAMVREGVKLVLSAHPPSTEVVRDLNQAGIVQIPIYMSNEFRHADIIAQAVNEVEPEEVLIHCAHGVDRSGNILAFLRVVFHGWPISDALYAVVNRDQEDLAGLIAVLQAAGINDVRTLDDPTVGYDSLVCVGRGGGMKARSDSYRRLIATNIIEMERYRR